MEVVQYHGDLRAQVSKLSHRPSLSKISLIFWTCCAGRIRYYTLILAKRPRSDNFRVDFSQFMDTLVVQWMKIEQSYVKSH